MRRERNAARRAREGRGFRSAVRVSALISALLLSLLCCLSYNLWKYEVERVSRERGNWHSRIAGAFGAAELEAARGFAHVESVEARATADGRALVELRFDRMRRTLALTPRIADLLGAGRGEIEYNRELLALYMIRDPNDSAPRMVLPLLAAIAALAALSLIAIIHNAFALRMNARLRSVGILSSVGATPRQIRALLLRDALLCCAGPVVAGNLAGMLGGAGLLWAINAINADVPGRMAARFELHPLLPISSLLLTLFTVWASAWMPARRLSKRTPLEAIRGAGEPERGRTRGPRLLARLFGVEGELAASALRAQRWALRTASVSLAVAFLAFALMQCFFTLSAINTRESYFDAFRESWDVMATVKGARIEDFTCTARLREIPGVESAAVYQKASAKRVVSPGEISDAMRAFGGFEGASERYVTRVRGGWLVNAPIVILDDESFLAYCARIGAEPRLDGAVVRNQIRDVTNPDFRHPTLCPYLRGERDASRLRGVDGGSVDVPVLAYADAVPALREEYAKLDYYELVHFLPLSLWRSIGDRIGGAQEDLYVRLLSEGDPGEAQLQRMQEALDEIVGAAHSVESENRIREREINDRQIAGMKAIFGGLCALLAIIGLGNLFSNALNFAQQRRRELARYRSIGATPAQLRKQFCIEALAIAARPALIALPISALAVARMLRMSFVETSTFLAEAPLAPVAGFLLAAFGCVALAYWIGWRGVRRLGLAELLRDDALL